MSETVSEPLPAAVIENITNRVLGAIMKELAQQR
jgi:hypothetical protein